jgi:hypothetical protein
VRCRQLHLTTSDFYRESDLMKIPKNSLLKISKFPYSKNFPKSNPDKSLKTKKRIHMKKNVTFEYFIVR